MIAKLTSALLVVSVVSTLLGASDLLLRRGQNAALQDAFETWTLRLDDLRVSGMLLLLATRRGIRAIGILEIILALAYVGYLVVSLAHRHALDVRGLVRVFWVSSVSFVPGVILFRRYGLRLLRTIVGDGSPLAFFFRAVLFYSLTSVVVILPMAGIFVIFGRLTGWVQTALFLTGLVVRGAMSLFLITLLVVLIAYAVPVAAVVLVLMKAVMWRIAEYPKGVFAAISLIVATAVGIYKLFIEPSTH